MMPFNIPFIPQTAISEQILLALKQGYEERQRGQELEQRKVEESRLQQRADAQINLESARQRLFEAQALRDEELDPIRKIKLQAEVDQTQFELEDARDRAKFFKTHELPLAPGESGFDLFAKAQRQQIEQGGALTPEEVAEFDAAVSVSKQERKLDKMYQVAKDIRAGRATRDRAEPAVEDDRKYQAVVMKQMLKQPVTPEEVAFKGAYEKRKTLSTTEAQAGALHRLQISMTGGDVGGQSVDSWVKQVNANPALLATAPRGLRNEIVKRTDLLLPPKIKEAFRGFDQAENLLDIIETQVQAVVDSPNAGERARNTLLLQGTVDSFSSILSRNVFTEVGVKTEGDINRAKSLLPGWKAANFDPNFAHRELDILRKLLQANRGVAINYASVGGLSEAQKSQQRSLGQGERPVYRNGKLVGYTKDGKIFSRLP